MCWADNAIGRDALQACIECFEPVGLFWVAVYEGVHGLAVAAHGCVESTFQTPWSFRQASIDIELFCY